MRSKHRYLAVRIYTPDTPPSESGFRNAIWERLRELYGELGVSQIGFWLISYHPSSQSAIIRCQHDQIRPLRAGLATITQIEASSLLLHVVGISGTIRKVVTFLPGLDAKTVVRPRKYH
ncbi:MAG: Rpp14/Pop5 family protein [Candidatus Thorarchaeota archaeon]